MSDHLHLIDILPDLKGVPVLVVGDLMLDRYIWGVVERISPEAPIPVLKVTNEEGRAGGAGSVMANLCALGAEVRAVGAIGTDQAGDRLMELLKEQRVDASGMVRSKSVETTQKTRLVARTQQLLRVDRDNHGVPAEVLRTMEARILDRLEGAKAVLLSDYGRGVLTDEIVRTVASECRKRGIPCIADPHPSSPFERFTGVTCMTPNRAETARAIDLKPVDDATQFEAARTLIERFELDFVTVTLDKDGIYLLEKGDTTGRRFGAKARSVYDVAGAGDMVLAVLGLAVGAGAKHVDAVRLANVAAGLEVERLGVQPISSDELKNELRYGAPPAARRKILTGSKLDMRLAEVRGSGARIVFTNGCFDLLHAGHVHFLQSCRAEGDFLVVGLNTDSSIKGLKGENRPVLPLEERGALLAALESVDLVSPFDEPTPIRLIERVKPDVLCKGEDYKGKLVVGREFVEGYGGKVQLVRLVPGLSTTNIIKRLVE